MITHHRIGIRPAARAFASAAGLLAVLGSLSAGLADGRDWPMFGGTPQRNPANPAVRGLPADWSIEPGKTFNVKWVAALGSRAYGSAVVAGGKVYIGTNNERPRDLQVQGDKGLLMCFAEADGTFLWQAVHDKLPSGMVNDWPREGIASSPAVEGNRLYYVSNRCELICADTEGFRDGKNDGVQDEFYRGPADADIVWRLDMIKEMGVFPHNLAVCSPLIVGDLVFVVTGNGVDESHSHVPAPLAPSFVAVDRRTGKVVWQDHSPTTSLLGVKERGVAREKAIRDLVDRGELLVHGQWSSPTYAVAGGQAQVIFPGGDGWLRAFDPPTGRLLWKFDGNPKAAKWVLGGRGTRNEFIATPVVWGGRLYIGVGQDPEHGEGVGHLWCIDLARAVRYGARNAGGDVSPVADNFDPRAPANAASALAWHFGGLADPAAVRAAEKARQARAVAAHAALVAGLARPLGALPSFLLLPDSTRDFVFGRTLSACAVHDGLVYAGELGGFLHCLDAATGRPYWVHDLRGALWGSAFCADGKVYVGTEDGDVFVFRHGKEKSLLGVMEMRHGIKGTPVAANGTLYVVTETALYALRQE